MRRRMIVGLLACGLLLLALPGVAAELGANVVLYVDASAVLIGADGEEKVPRDVYSSILSICEEGCAPEEELFAAMPFGAEDGSCLLLDANGTALTGPDYQALSRHGENIWFMQDELYGVMDKELQVILPCAYTQLVEAGEGYLALTSDPYDEQPDGVYSIDGEGEETATGVRVVYGLNEIVEGRMPVTSPDAGRMGYLDETGAWAIQPQYDYCGAFQNGRATAAIKSGVGVIDRDGNWLLTPKYTSVTLSDAGEEMILAEILGKSICLIDLETYQPKATFTGDSLYCISHIDNGRAVLYDAESVRVIDQDGNVIFTRDPLATIDVWGEMGDMLIVQEGVQGEESMNLYQLPDTRVFGPKQEIWLLGRADGQNYFAFATYEVTADGDPALDWYGYWAVDGTRKVGVAREDGTVVLEADTYRELYYAADGVLIYEKENEVGLLDMEGNVLRSYEVKGGEAAYD